MGIELDTSHWPIIVTTFLGKPSDEDFRQYCERFEDEVLARHSTFASLVDTTGFDGIPSARQRKRLAEWQSENHVTGSRWNAGIAYVFSSPLLRGALTALQWLYTPDVPVQICASRQEAHAWLARQVGRRTSDLVPRGAPVRSEPDSGTQDLVG